MSLVGNASAEVDRKAVECSAWTGQLELSSVGGGGSDSLRFDLERNLLCGVENRGRNKRGSKVLRSVGGRAREGREAILTFCDLKWICGLSTNFYRGDFSPPRPTRLPTAISGVSWPLAKNRLLDFSKAVEAGTAYPGSCRWVGRIGDGRSRRSCKGENVDQLKMRFILLFGFVFSFLKKKKRKRTATLRPSHRTMRGSGQTNQPLLLNDWMLTERQPGCEHSDMALPDERIRILRQRAHDQLCGKLCRASCGVYIYSVYSVHIYIYIYFSRIPLGW